MPAFMPQVNARAHARGTPPDPTPPYRFPVRYLKRRRPHFLPVKPTSSFKIGAFGR
jgi:hypothetical protein